MSICHFASLDISGILSPFEEFEVLLEQSWSGHLQLGQRPKRKPNKTKLKSKIELNQCFWSILCYSEFSVIKRHVLKVEKLMDKAHVYKLFIFGGHVLTMLGLYLA